MKIKAGIVGATGYVGQELVRLLVNHPNVDIVGLASKSYAGKSYSEVYPNHFQIVDETILPIEVEKLADVVDVLFFALPHGITSSLVTEEIIVKTKVIDLGADYRFEDLDMYESWYTTHHSKSINAKSIYGLHELHQEDIKNAQIIGNPGCYTTTSILALAPLMNQPYINKKSIIINAASGVSGAGRSAKQALLYTETNESYKAYGIANHRHTPEIEQELSKLAGESIHVLFVPHLVPMNRGILATCYVNLIEEVTEEEIYKLYQTFYRNKTFVRILKQNQYPETKWVKGSNYIDINIKVDTRTNRLIVIAAIDNLVKGAAGQAIQNMNTMFDFEETAGLSVVPIFP